MRIAICCSAAILARRRLLPARFGCPGCERLVQEQEFRSAYECVRYQGPLQLASRELPTRESAKPEASTASSMASTSCRGAETAAACRPGRRSIPRATRSRPLGERPDPMSMLWERSDEPDCDAARRPTKNTLPTKAFPAKNHPEDGRLACALDPMRPVSSPA